MISGTPLPYAVVLTRCLNMRSRVAGPRFSRVIAPEILLGTFGLFARLIIPPSLHDDGIRTTVVATYSR